MNTLVQEVGKRNQGKRQSLDVAMGAGRQQRREDVAGEQQGNANHGDGSQKDRDGSVVWIGAGVHGYKVIVITVKKR